MCPTFSPNPVLKYTKCHISTNLLRFLKALFTILQKIILPLLRQIAESLKKIGLVGTLGLTGVNVPLLQTNVEISNADVCVEASAVRHASV